MTKIKDILIESNPWWKKEFTVEFRYREIYDDVKKFLSLPQIISFTGLRRVGKTTLMFKIIEDSIKGKINPKNILYFSFDEFKDLEIRNVINIYEDILQKDLKHGKYLFLFDEIQKISNWEEQLKRIYDTFKGSVKIIISGSESLFMIKKSKETLAGRIYEFKIEPLTFKEFLCFKGVKYKPVDIYRKELRRLFDEFVLTMGFPELVGVKDKMVIKKYVKESILEKVIYKDIPNLFNVKDISVIDTLINIFCEEPGSIVEIVDLSKDLKISRQTLSNYLKYLENSFLLRKLYNFSRSRRKVERKLKKYYPEIISVDLIFKEDNFSKSKIFEWIVVKQIKSEFFWRDSYKNEVDIVLAEKKPMPIEIKYGKISTQGVISFMKKFKVNKGYIVSYDREDNLKIEDKNIKIVPAYKFLLARGKFLLNYNSK